MISSDDYVLFITSIDETLYYKEKIIDLIVIMTYENPLRKSFYINGEGRWWFLLSVNAFYCSSY